MKNRFLIILIFSILPAIGFSQNIKDFLVQVEENDPELKAYQKLLESRKIEARTGIFPSDPEVGLGFFPEQETMSGNKNTWSVSQSVEFPTKYLLQKKISRNSVVLAEQEFMLGKVKTLLLSEYLVYDLIYKRKMLEMIDNRLAEFLTLKAAWNKMIATGATTILEYNKISLELTSAELEKRKTESEIKMLLKQLDYMSGSRTDLLSGADYEIPGTPDLEQILAEKTLLHPAFLIPLTEYYITNQKVALSKSEGLPDLSVGYASEATPGERYTGPTLGFSVPLWSNTNNVKNAKAESDYMKVKMESELMRLRSELVKDYDNYTSLKYSLDQLNEQYNAYGSKKYLDLALEQREITINEYFSYLSITYDTEDKLLMLENEFYKSLAVLLDYRLLERN